MYALKNLGGLEVRITSKVARFMFSSMNTRRSVEKTVDALLPPLPQPSSTVRLNPRASEYQASMEEIKNMTDSLQQVSLAPELPPQSLKPMLGLTLLAHPLPIRRQWTPPKSPTISTPKKKKDPKVTLIPHKKRDASGRSTKVLPSRASGGVPNASPEYLQGCQIIPRVLKDPQQLLVVIDLNGTLLYRPNRKNPTKFLSRPNAELFLKYCIDTFKIVIWSSAKPENVASMCNTILTPELRRKVVAIWGRDKFNLSPTDFQLRVQCYKRLTSIWKDPNIAASHPRYRFGGKWDQTNTVLIDDSIEKARSEPFNLIEVPDWTGDLEDYALPNVHDYLNHLSLHSNVSGCLHANPFKPHSRR
jgi:hypothetical protein